MPLPKDALLAMRDIMDGQLETSDDRRIGRVADLEAEWREDGTLVLERILTGPEALAGRLSSRLRPLAHALLHGKFEHSIPIDQVDDVGPTIQLRGKAEDYSVGESDRWIAKHILRFLPGSGS